jgi:CBS domain-containing protein
MSIEEAQNIMERRRFTSLLVGEGKRLIRIVTLLDIKRLYGTG